MVVRAFVDKRLQGRCPRSFRALVLAVSGKADGEQINLIVKFRLLAIGLPSILALAGCVAGPNYTPPQSATLGLEVSYIAPLPTGGRDRDHISLIAWWRSFGDPQLSDLVQQAIADNLDIAVASSRLLQAREAAIQAGAARLPQLGVSAGVARNGYATGRPATVFPGIGGRSVNATAADSTNLSIAGDASYTVDLFGGITRSVEAASASSDAAAFDVAALRVTIAANTASSYIQGRIAQDRLAIAKDSLANAEDNLEIAQWRVRAGLVSATDVEQARTQRAQQRSALPLLEANIANAASNIALLTGQAPSASATLFAQSLPIPQPQDNIAVGVPTDTLRQRPDVAAAERRLAAVSAQIGVAQARLYPALSLTGNLASNASGLSSVLNQVSFGLAGNLAQTIFDGGRLRSQVRSQKAAAVGALADYRRTVLSGLRDVENALQNLWSADARLTSQREAVEAARSSAIYARSRYRSGLIDFTTLLTIENQLLSARDGYALTAGDRALATVQLYAALGGGFGSANGALPALPMQTATSAETPAP